MEIDNDKMKLIEKYILDNREQWFKTDIEWIYPNPTSKNSYNWEFLKCQRQISDGVKFDVFKRETNREPDTVFYYWNGNHVNLNFEDTVYFFTKLIKLTNNWTSIFTYGELLHQMKDNFVWYQRYEPNVPFVKARNLIGIYAVKYYKDDELPIDLKGHEVALISLRSVPKDIVPITLPDEPQILWHGAYLLISDNDKTRVHKFDSEDQKGWLPQWLTNFAFPKYVQEEAVLATKYIKENPDILLNNIDL